MARGRPKAVLVLTSQEDHQIRALANSRSMPHALVRRAQIVLLSAEGQSNSAIARKLGLCAASVGKWRRRFLEQGIQGLHDELRPGRPRSISDEEVASLLTTTIHSKPRHRTHWSCRSIAHETGISKSTVSRIWRAFALAPHRQRHFNLSTDPFFVEKVRDIVGLYLNPPDKAMVLCVDEKTHIQALDRTQPLLPMGLGYVEGVTHDYVRHGTTTLFAALEVATGQVITQCKPRHRHQEFLRFLRHLDATVPPDIDLHLIVDNYGTHKHPNVKLWLAKRSRYHMHYTPTYSSWLNQVELWFSIISQQAIRRGTFRSVRDLVHAIDRFVETYNSHTRPFVWTATAESILDKVKRLCKYISGTRHQ